MCVHGSVSQGRLYKHLSLRPGVQVYSHCTDSDIVARTVGSCGHRWHASDATDVEKWMIRAADLCYHLDTGHLNQGVGITQAPDQRTDRGLNGPNLIIATCSDSLGQNIPSWIVSPSLKMVS